MRQELPEAVVKAGEIVTEADEQHTNSESIQGLMADNVIVFPKNNARTENKLPTAEELQQERFSRDELAIDESTDLLIAVMMETLASLGFKPDEEQAKAVCMSMESMRSMMSAFYGREHPFHSIAEACFEVTSPDGPLVFVPPTIKVKTTSIEPVPEEE